jgi:hypothetical protein
MSGIGKGAFGARQLSKVERLPAKRDDPTAEDQGGDIPWDFLMHPTTEVPFGNM